MINLNITVVYLTTVLIYLYAVSQFNVSDCLPLLSLVISIDCLAVVVSSPFC